MKKISLSLNLGIVGLKSSNPNPEKELFINYLKGAAVKSQNETVQVISHEYYEFLVVFQEIPIKVKLYFLNNIDDLISKYNKIKSLDIIILAFNIKETDSINLITRERFSNFKEHYNFQGLSILTAINLNDTNKSDELRIQPNLLIRMIMELDLIYGFELRSEEEDVAEFFNKIFEDFIFKFKISSPEIVDLSKNYGKELLQKY